jgi:hypothetical protein
MSRLELWARVESEGSSNDYTYAVYDIDIDRVWWYESEHDAKAHFRSGRPVPPVSTVGHRSSSHPGSDA